MKAGVRTVHRRRRLVMMKLHLMLATGGVGQCRLLATDVAAAPATTASASAATTTLLMMSLRVLVVGMMMRTGEG